MDKKHLNQIMWSAIVGIIAAFLFTPRVHATATTNTEKFTGWTQINIASSPVSQASGGTVASQSDAINNYANGCLEILWACEYTSAAAGTVSTGSLAMYGAGTVTSNKLTDGIGVSSATLTISATQINSRPFCPCAIIANSTIYDCGPCALSSAFGGVLPDTVAVIIQNMSGATLKAGSCWYNCVNTQNQ
jgi:hypothetical protein